jgi:hypothetical protein
MKIAVIAITLAVGLLTRPATAGEPWETDRIIPFNQLGQPSEAEQRAAKEALDRRDDLKCQGYGLHFGEAGYAQCRLQIENNRNNRRGVTCTTYGSTTTCY